MLDVHAVNAASGGWKESLSFWLERYVQNFQNRSHDTRLIRFVSQNHLARNLNQPQGTNMRKIPFAYGMKAWLLDSLALLPFSGRRVSSHKSIRQA